MWSSIAHGPSCAVGDLGSFGGIPNGGGWKGTVLQWPDRLRDPVKYRVL